MATDLSPKWGRIARLYEQLGEDLVPIDFKRDMLDLVTHLASHHGFEHLESGLSHYMLTLTGENSRRSLTIGWRRVGWHHISACSVLNAQEVIDTLQATMQQIVNAIPIDRALTAYPGNLASDYDEKIRDWDSIINYFQERALDGSSFALQMLDILSVIRVRPSFAGTGVWASRSRAAIGVEIPGSRRFIVIASPIAPQIWLCEEIDVASGEVVSVVQDLVQRL